jgi:hypothetical protein
VVGEKLAQIPKTGTRKWGMDKNRKTKGWYGGLKTREKT